MSLDVYLKTEELHSCEGSGIYIRENGSMREITREEWDAKFPGSKPVTVIRDTETNTVYTGNITHNLNHMAGAAFIYSALWEPETLGIHRAGQLKEPLTRGLRVLKQWPEMFKLLNPANGWGDYDGLVAFVEDYLAACTKYPEAKVEVCK